MPEYAEAGVSQAEIASSKIASARAGFDHDGRFSAPPACSRHALTRDSFWAFGGRPEAEFLAWTNVGAITFPFLTVS